MKHACYIMQNFHKAHRILEDPTIISNT